MPESVLSELYQEYHGLVSATIFQVVRDPDLTQDYAQEVWIRVAKSHASFRGDSKVSSWLYKIAIHTAISCERKRRVRTRAETRRITPVEVDSDEASLTDDGLTQQLSQVLRTLPTGMRRVLLLHDSLGFTHEEIATELEILPVSSRSQLSRARSRTRLLLAKSGHVASALLLGSVISTVGCRPDHGSQGLSVQVVDSAGILISSNRADGSPPHAFTVALDLTIGVQRGDPMSEFGQVAGITTDHQGRIHVLDAQARTVRVFGNDGQFVTEFAGPGQGPGELARAPNAIWFGNNQLFVSDPGNARANVYDGERRSLPPIPVDFAQGVPEAWHSLPDGTLLQRWGGASEGVRRMTQGGDLLDTVMVFDYPRPSVGTRDAPLAPLLHPHPMWAVVESGLIATATSDVYRIKLWSPGGDLLRIYQLARPRRAVLPSDAAGLLNLWERRLAIGDIPRAFATLITPVLPDSLPAIAALFSGPENTLWVQHGADVSEMQPDEFSGGPLRNLGGRTWDVFDDRGQMTGIVELPGRFRLFHTRGLAIYGVFQDAVGVQRVMRLRVLRSP